MQSGEELSSRITLVYLFKHRPDKAEMVQAFQQLLEVAFSKKKPQDAIRLICDDPKEGMYRPLYVAVECKLLPIVKTLIRYGGKECLNQRNPEGRTALHVAVKDEGYAVVAALLVKAGADATLRDDSGRTPLEFLSKSPVDTPAVKAWKRTMRAALTRLCWQCEGKKGAERNLMTCSKCGLAKYCESECQLLHWKSHKAECSEFCGK